MIEVSHHTSQTQPGSEMRWKMILFDSKDFRLVHLRKGRKRDRLKIPIKNSNCYFFTRYNFGIFFVSFLFSRCIWDTMAQIKIKSSKGELNPNHSNTIRICPIEGKRTLVFFFKQSDTKLYPPEMLYIYFGTWRYRL